MLAGYIFQHFRQDLYRPLSMKFALSDEIIHFKF